MLVFEKEPVVLISLNKYMPLEKRKKKYIYIYIYPILEPFNQTLNKYIPAESKTSKNKNSEDHITSTLMPKFEKFLWRIWKIKSSDSGSNLCTLYELDQVATMEATKMNQKPIIID